MYVSWLPSSDGYDWSDLAISVAGAQSTLSPIVTPVVGESGLGGSLGGLTGEA